MTAVFISVLSVIAPISLLLTPALLISFAACAVWYFISEKRYVPLTQNEVKLLWKIHKQSCKCHAAKWRELKRQDKIVGFECECGYRRVQKRSLI